MFDPTVFPICDKIECKALRPGTIAQVVFRTRHTDSLRMDRGWPASAAITTRMDISPLHRVSPSTQAQHSTAQLFLHDDDALPQDRSLFGGGSPSKWLMPPIIGGKEQFEGSTSTCSVQHESHSTHIPGSCRSCERWGLRVVPPGS